MAKTLLDTFLPNPTLEHIFQGLQHSRHRKRDHFTARRIDHQNFSLPLRRNGESGSMTGSRNEICEGGIAKRLTAILQYFCEDDETADL